MSQTPPENDRSADDGESVGRTSDDPSASETPDAPETVQAELERLRAENERLRARYDDSRRTRHRRTALGLAAVGLVAGGVAAIAPAVREPLIGVAAIGLFSAVVTWYLTPEQFIPADVGRSTFDPLSRNEAAIVDQLGLSGDRIYLETADESFRLFVPQSSSTPPPDDAALERPFVVTGDREESGVALEPSGAVLYNEHAATRATAPSSASDAVAQLGESMRENFELLRSIDAEVDADDSRVSVEVVDPAYGGLDAFDHPIVSLLGVGLAAHLEQPVRAEVSRLESGAWSITYRW